MAGYSRLADGRKGRPPLIEALGRGLHLADCKTGSINDYDDAVAAIPWTDLLMGQYKHQPELLKVIGRFLYFAPAQ
jgi:hypothetical protein